MARAPVPGGCKTRLEPRLGPEGCARLQAALIRLTLAAASEFAPGRVVVAHDGPVEADAVLVAQRGQEPAERLAAAAADAHERFGGPLVIVGTDLPRLTTVHLALAVDDLAAGADVAFGSTYAGGFYLVATQDPRPELFSIPAADRGGPAMLARLLAATQAAGLEVGMLRMERELETPADADALLADPLLPEAIRAVLTA